MYSFKPIQEIAWATFLVAAGIFLPFLIGADEAKLGSPAFWTGVGVAVLRGVAGYLLSLIPQGYHE